MKRSRKIGLLLPFIIAAAASCDDSNHVSGTFEEAMISGRLFASDYREPPLDRFRFFRFRIQQYGADIGGIFESFDFATYAEFIQAANYSSYPISDYYCGRIESSYFQGDRAFIKFIDREQRHWMYIADSHDGVLSGRIYRVSIGDNSWISTPYEYLMPEDALYYQNDGSPTSEMILTLKDTVENEFKNCDYYFKTSTINFAVPDDVYKRCSDDKLCPNLRLAIVATKPMPLALASQAPYTTELLSATLSNVDRTGNLRPIAMRDNPNYYYRTSSGLVTATALIFEDSNQNGHWESDEPIYAALDKNLLLFIDESTATTFFGAYPKEYESLATPKISILQDDKDDPFEIGWNIAADTSITPDGRMFRLPTAIRKTINPIVLTSLLDEAPNGCRLDFNASPSDEFPQCNHVLPLIYF